MMMEKVLSRSLRVMFAGGMATSMLMAAQVAQAQDAPIQRVEITGSSIKRIASESALPVQTITQEEIRKSGATSAAELIQALPSMQGFTTSSQSVNGGGGGTTTASIHSIGDSYTLVLLNGRRLASFGSGSTVNLGSIPLAAVERIEVLTDGASTLYGSDAIAGVVNFILKKNQTDAVIEAAYHSPQHKGGKGSTVSISKGFGDLDKNGFNILAAYSHDEQKSLDAKDRPFANTGVRRFDNAGKQYYLYQLAINTAPASAGLTLTTPRNGQTNVTFSPNFMTNGSCGPNTFPVADAGGATSCWFDYSATVQLIPDQKRDSLFLSGNVKLGQNHTLFAEAVASKYEVIARFAPAAQRLALAKTDPLYTKYITPHLATLGISDASVSKAQMNLRLADAGGRTNRYVAEARHMVIGAEGNLFGIDYNTSLTHSTNEGESYYWGGYLSNDKYKAIRAAGQFDPFGAPGTSAAALAPAVLKTLDTRVNSELDVFKLSGSRDLFSMAGGKAMLGAGVDATRQGYEISPSAISQGANVQQPTYTDTPLGSAPGALPAAATQKSYGAFAELLMPITKSFDITAAIRYDAYKAVNSTINFDVPGNLVGAKTLGNDNSKATYKFATSWRPTDSVLLRASYGTGFKNPSMGNIISPLQNAGVTSGKYNCPVVAPNPLASLCNGNTQYDLISGGNPTSGASGLKPELSKQGTVGIRLEPTAAVSLGFDFWDVKMEDQIVTLAEQKLFGEPEKFQGLFSKVFDSGVGSDILVGAITPTNAATSHYQGIDWDHTFKATTGLGKLSMNWLGTWTHRSESNDPDGAGLIKSVGRFDEYNNVALRWQTKLVTTLVTSPMWQHTLTGNWRSGYQDQSSTLSGGTVRTVRADGGVGVPVVVDRKVSDYYTFDWQTKMTVQKNLVVTAGIKNLLDTEPSLSIRTAGGGNQVGYDGRYSDPVGRLFYIKGSYRF